jgi:hypothetical protein
MQIITALISALALASSTSALAVTEPVRRGEDLVYSPRVTSPQGGEVWKVGTKQKVTWDKSSTPPKVYGKLLLGYLEDGSANEHLDLGEFHFGPPSHTPPLETFCSVLTCRHYAPIYLCRSPSCN